MWGGVEFVGVGGWLVTDWLALLASEVGCCWSMCVCVSLWCHFMQSHIYRVHTCVLNCHLHFWQGGWDLLVFLLLK